VRPLGRSGHSPCLSHSHSASSRAPRSIARPFPPPLPPRSEQIKGWAASPEIKNKQPLLDARANIERRMETFKVVEREAKTKAYSKEGLMRDQPMSAEEKKRQKSKDWVQELISKLSDAIEELSGELETLGGSRHVGWVCTEDRCIHHRLRRLTRISLLVLPPQSPPHPPPARLHSQSPRASPGRRRSRQRPHSRR
jgi:hypothetical protein